MTPIEPNAPIQLKDADLKPRGTEKAHSSPATWRDQILYLS